MREGLAQQSTSKDEKRANENEEKWRKSAYTPVNYTLACIMRPDEYGLCQLHVREAKETRGE